VNRAVETPAAPQLNPKPFRTTFCSFRRSKRERCVKVLAPVRREVVVGDSLLPAQTKVTGRVTVWNLSFKSWIESSSGFFTRLRYSESDQSMSTKCFES